MNIFELAEFINRKDVKEKGKKIIEKLSAFNSIAYNIETADYMQVKLLISQISEAMAVIQNIDLFKLSDAIDKLPENVKESANIWANYGWVPYLPNCGIGELINIKFPKTQEEADEIIMQRLDDVGVKILIDKLTDKVKFHSHNLETFEEAVNSYKAGLYSGCSLLLFAIIDSCFIIGQPIPPKDSKNSKRKLAGSAVKDAVNEDKYNIAIFAYTTKNIIDRLFKYANDFDPSEEDGLSRNFLSHGMNQYTPNRKDCLQLFVLLYNIYVSFDSKCFMWNKS